MRHLLSILLLFFTWNSVNGQHMTRYFVHMDNEGRITYSFTPGPSAMKNLLLSSEQFNEESDSDMTLPTETTEEYTTTAQTSIATTVPVHYHTLESHAPLIGHSRSRSFPIHYRVRYVTKPPRTDVSSQISNEDSNDTRTPKLILTNATGDLIKEKFKKLKSSEDINALIVPLEVSFKIVNGRKVFPEGYRPPNVFVRPIWKHPRLMTLPPTRPNFMEEATTTTGTPQLEQFAASERPTPSRVVRPRFLTGRRVDLKKILKRLRMPVAQTTQESDTTTTTQSRFNSIENADPSRSSFRFRPQIAERRGPFLVGFRVKRPFPQFTVSTTPEPTTTTEPTKTEETTTITTTTVEAITVTEGQILRRLKSSSSSDSSETQKERVKSNSESSEEKKEDEVTMTEETTTVAVWPETSSVADELVAEQTTSTESVTDASTESTLSSTDTDITQESTTELPTSTELSVPTEQETTTVSEESTATTPSEISKTGPSESVPAAEVTQEEGDTIDLNEITNDISAGLEPTSEITKQVREIWELKRRLDSENTDVMRARILDAEQRLEDLFISLRKSRRRMKAKMARS